MAKKTKKYVIEYCDLTKDQKESLRAYLSNAGPFSNGSSFDYTLEIVDGDELNSMDKLMIELGYVDGDEILFRLSW